jgi:hypothetical protein
MLWLVSLMDGIVLEPQPKIWGVSVFQLGVGFLQTRIIRTRDPSLAILKKYVDRVTVIRSFH